MLQLEYSPYIWPFVLSLLVSASLGLYAFRRRAVPAAATFAWIMAALWYWTACYVLELSSATLAGKLFWASAKYLGSVSGPLLWLVLAIQVTQYGHWLKNKIFLASLWAIGLIIPLVVFTNNLHHWYWTEVQLVAGEPETVAEHGFFFWIYAAVAYLTILISVGLFFNYYRVTPRLYRQQATLFALGAFIPLGGRILEDFFGFDLFPKIDNVILLLLFSGLLWAVAIFRYGGLNLVHIAHNLVIQNIKAGIIVLDMQGRVIEMNPYAQALVGLPQAQAIGKPLQQTLAAWAGLNNPEGEISIQYEGEEGHFSIQTSPIKDSDGSLAGHAIVLFNITAQKLAERQLERLARTDALTQIVNRRYFFELAAAEFTRAWRYDHAVAILMFDIDHFKKVNDTYGHQAGDEVLKLVAAQCQWELRATDIFARYGGEEFICMLIESTPEGAHATAERIRKLIETARPEFEGQVVRVTLSIGLAAAAPIANLTLEALITRADQALFEAKAAGRNCVKVWGE